MKKKNSWPIMRKKNVILNNSLARFDRLVKYIYTFYFLLRITIFVNELAHVLAAKIARPVHSLSFNSEHRHGCEIIIILKIKRKSENGVRFLLRISERRRHPRQRLPLPRYTSFCTKISIDSYIRIHSVRSACGCAAIT